jgi:hypothetical protein
MATLWIVRKKHTGDPLLAALDGIRQALVAREAEKQDLHYYYEEYEDEWVDMAVVGPVDKLTEVIKECAGQGVANFAIAIETEDDEKETEKAEKVVDELNKQFPIVGFAG